MFDDIEDYQHFVKIKRRNRSYLDPRGVLCEAQARGTVQKVEDSKVFHKDHQKLRPGVVLYSPSSQSYETGWVPFSSIVTNRPYTDTVYLHPETEQVEEPCYALLRFFGWFMCTTLKPAKGMLSDTVMEEIESKLKEMV